MVVKDKDQNIYANGLVSLLLTLGEDVNDGFDNIDEEQLTLRQLHCDRNMQRDVQKPLAQMAAEEPFIGCSIESHSLSEVDEMNMAFEQQCLSNDQMLRKRVAVEQDVCVEELANELKLDRTKFIDEWNDLFESYSIKHSEL